MSDELTYDEILDKLPAYALGALEPEEMLAIDAYIHKHEVLLVRLRESEQAAVQLAYLAPLAPLPANAKDRLLERVRADGKTIKTSEAVAGPSRTDATVPQPRAAQAEPVVKPLLTPKRSWLAGFWTAISSRNGWALAAGTAMLILLALAGFYIIQMQARLQQVNVERNNLETKLVQLEISHDQLQAQLRQTEAELEAVQLEIARWQSSNESLEQINEELREQLQTENSHLNFVAHTPPDRTVLLPGTEAAPEAHGLLYLGPQNNEALLVLNQLSPLPPQETYQLWLIPENEAPIPVGLLPVQSDAPTWLRVQIPPEAQDFADVGVSKEPAGGSLTPTGPIVLLGTVS
jgi:anti-sigma-K factor RskA